MTVTHEMGHVIAGWLNGAKLHHLELRPWHLPHSQMVDDRFPLWTVIAGPMLGTILPIAIAIPLRNRSLWLVAWFCLVANGLYLLLGLFSSGMELDTNKMIRLGASDGLVAIISIAMTALGYWQFRRACIEFLDDEQISVRPRFLASLAGSWILANSLLAFAVV